MPLAGCSAAAVSAVTHTPIYIEYPTATITIPCSAAIVWSTWNSVYQATYVTAGNSSVATWYDWNHQYANTSANIYQGVVTAGLSQEAEAVYQARLDAEVEALKQRNAAIKVKRDEADKKAESLLKSLLLPEQRNQYERERIFELFTNRNGERRRYRIKHGSAGNIFRVDEAGCEVEKYCIHATGNFPNADNMVAQMLLLQADEEQFLRVANKTVLTAVGRRAA